MLYLLRMREFREEGSAVTAEVYFHFITATPGDLVLICYTCKVKS